MMHSAAIHQKFLLIFASGFQTQNYLPHLMMLQHFTTRNLPKYMERVIDDTIEKDKL
jgi:hypothetical protein